MKKTTIYLVLATICLVIIGCTTTVQTPAPTVTKFVNSGNGILTLDFSDGTNQDVNISAIVKQACPVPEPTVIYRNVTTIQTVTVCNSSVALNLLSCQEKLSGLMSDYVDCQLNVSSATASFNGTCTTALANCNETLTDYTNRLNNITYYASHFYTAHAGDNADCTNQLYSMNVSLIDCINRINNITWYSNANR